MAKASISNNGSTKTKVSAGLSQTTPAPTSNVYSFRIKIINVPGWLSNDDDDLWPKYDGFAYFDLASNPQLEPIAVINELEADINSYIAKGYSVCLIGHSLGGYYVACMAEKYGLPAVLINPLVKAHESLLLASALEDEPKLKIVKAQLQGLEVLTSHPDSLMVMLQKGDKQQDYRIAMDYYRDCNQIILNGGSHEFHDLDSWIVAIGRFFVSHYE